MACCCAEHAGAFEKIDRTCPNCSVHHSTTVGQVILQGEAAMAKLAQEISDARDRVVAQRDEAIRLLEEVISNEAVTFDWEERAKDYLFRVKW